MSQSHTTPIRGRLWQPVEIILKACHVYDNPFIEVAVTAHLHSPSGRSLQARAFYAGADRWLIRFTPDEKGRWAFTTLASPEDPGLMTAGRVDVAPAAEEAHGILRLTTEPPWNAAFASGHVPYLLGDTIFNLFGAAHCGLDVEAVLRQRQAQGFRLIRARVPVSPFHPPNAHNAWQNHPLWPWGGSAQYPLLDRLQLAYFETVERVLELAGQLGMGFELVLEAWMFESPFNDRGTFTAELEALWLRYIVSRFSAYPSVYLWTLALEYERYPDGELAWSPLVDRWAAGCARRMRAWDPHPRCVAVDAVVAEPPLQWRFQRFPEIGALCHRPATAPDDRQKPQGMAAAVAAHLTGSGKINVTTAPGYERCPELTPALPEERQLDTGQLLRTAWSALFAGTHVVVGFENTWGPHLAPEQDPPGAGRLRHLTEFVAATPFPDLAPGPPASGAALQDTRADGTRCMLQSKHSPFLAVYLPQARGCTLTRQQLPGGAELQFAWYEAATGRRLEAVPESDGGGAAYDFTVPAAAQEDPDAGHAGWVLLVDGRRR